MMKFSIGLFVVCALFCGCSVQTQDETQQEPQTKQENAKTSLVDEPAKVFLISGRSNWEYRMLKSTLHRDKRFLVSCWLQSLDFTREQEGDAVIEELPRTLEQLQRYDAIVLIDPDPEDFDSGLIDTLRKACESGVGLMYVAGNQSSLEFMTMNRLSAIHEFFPVTWDKEDLINKATFEGSEQLVQVFEEQSFHVLASDQNENQEIWNVAAKINWNVPLTGVKEDATALQVLKNGVPILVTQKLGNGQIVFMGHNTVWRLRSTGVRAEYYDKFWTQTIAHLAQRSLNEEPSSQEAELP